MAAPLRARSAYCRGKSFAKGKSKGENRTVDCYSYRAVIAILYPFHASPLSVSRKDFRIKIIKFLPLLRTGLRTEPLQSKDFVFRQLPRTKACGFRSSAFTMIGNSSFGLVPIMFTALLGTPSRAVHFPIYLTIGSFRSGKPCL